jgi:hypothetical protein
MTHPPWDAFQRCLACAVLLFTEVSQKGSVIVHTHERARNLYPILEPLAALSLPEHRLKLCVEGEVSQRAQQLFLAVTRRSF